MGVIRRRRNATIKQAGNLEVDVVPSLPASESLPRAELVSELENSSFKISSEFLLLTYSHF